MAIGRTVLKLTLKLKMQIGAQSTQKLKDQHTNLPLKGNSVPIRELQVCGQRDFKTVFTLAMKHHTQHAHSEITNKLDTSVKKIPIDDNSDKGLITLHECLLCRYKAPTSKKLIAHVKRNHSMQDGSLFKNKYKKSHRCGYCDFKTHTAGKLKFHMKSHDTKYCSKCSYVTNTKVSLAEHMKTRHASVKDKLCPESRCDYATDAKEKLDNHIMKIHLKVKDKICELCGYATNQTAALALHVKAKHANMKAQQCPYCDSEFSWATNLESHIKAVHHQIRNHKCPTCNYASNRCSNLARHIKAHHDKIEDNNVVNSRINEEITDFLIKTEDD